MTQTVTVLVICHGRLIRDAIVETLAGENLTIVWEGDTLEGYEESATTVDVGIYVLSGASEAEALSEAKLLLPLKVRNCLILCDDKENELCNALFTNERAVSTAPIDVTRLDLIQLVQLAGSNRRLCVDTMCERCPATMRNPLITKSLSEDQLRLMRYLSEGYSNKLIARIEKCSESLVKIRMRSLFDKVGAANRTQAAVIAARAGLSYRVPDPPSLPAHSRAER